MAEIFFGKSFYLVKIYKTDIYDHSYAYTLYNTRAYIYIYNYTHSLVFANTLQSRIICELAMFLFMFTIYSYTCLCTIIMYNYAHVDFLNTHTLSYARMLHTCTHNDMYTHTHTHNTTHTHAHVVGYHIFMSRHIAEMLAIVSDMLIVYPLCIHIHAHMHTHGSFWTHTHTTCVHIHKRTHTCKLAYVCTHVQWEITGVSTGNLVFN